MSKQIDKQTLFPYKLNEILHNEEAGKYIVWKCQSNTIQITNLKGFQQNVLPLYFRHGKFQSFVRQMNLYGFRKHRSTKTHIFTHESLDTEINLLALKSRYQKRRQTLLEEQNQKKHLEALRQEQKLINTDLNAQNSGTIQSGFRQNQNYELKMNMDLANHQEYENFVLNNTFSFPFMNPYCFYGWNPIFPQANFFRIDQF